MRLFLRRKLGDGLHGVSLESHQCPLIYRAWFQWALGLFVIAALLFGGGR